MSKYANKQKLDRVIVPGTRNSRLLRNRKPCEYQGKKSLPLIETLPLRRPPPTQLPNDDPKRHTRPIACTKEEGHGKKEKRKGTTKPNTPVKGIADREGE